MKHEEHSLKTKMAFAAALKKAMTKKRLSDITVKELIEACNVDRKTFYYHFEDIYELLKWILDREAIEVVRHFDLLSDYKEAILFVIRYVDENKHILYCAYDSMGRDQLKRFFYADFIGLMQSTVRAAQKRLNIQIEEEFESFLCDMYTESIASLLINMFQGERQLDVNKTLRHISLIFQVSMQELLLRAPKACDTFQESQWNNAT